jgi:putative Mg2+ transporter-C (MgtC) family protein
MEEGAFSPVHISWCDALARFAAAFLLSLAVGMERFLRHKPIDFRPFVLIAVASCALVLGIAEFGYRTEQDEFSIDPAKVVSGIMTGIGFIGAGALFREKHVVHGAGSAASIWAAGALGIVCGLGMLWLAGLLTTALLIILIASRPFTKAYTIRVDDDEESEEKV